MSKKKAKPTSSPAVAPAKAGRTKTSSEPWHLQNWFLLAFGGLLLAVLAAFSGAFSHEFVSWDDHVYVYENPQILNATAANFKAFSTQVVSLNYHPLTMWSLWLNSALFGAGAKSFIVTNVLIHWLNAGLLCWLVWLLTGRQYRSVALLTALLFAIHPLRAESVVWVSERKDVLYVFFFLAGCISYWRYLETQRSTKLWIALIFMLLSCLSKGVAVVFPLVCLLLDYWHGRKFGVNWIVEKIPLFALSLLFGLIALDVQQGGDFHGLLALSTEKTKALSTVFGLDKKILFAGYGYMMYFVKTFLPLDLCTFYPYPTEVELRGGIYIGGAIFMLATLALAVCPPSPRLRRVKILSFGFGWVFATVILVLQFVSVGVVIMADRYFYLPSAGVFFMLTYAAEVFVLKNKPALRNIWWAIIGLFAVWCLWLSRAQTKTWKNSETLWQQVLRYYPDEDQALESLANWYGKVNRVPEAEQMLERAVKDGCTRPNVYSALANCIAIKAAAAKDPSAQRAFQDRAFSLYAQSIALNPNNADTYFNRALTALTVYPERALADLDTAATLAPHKALQFKQMRGTVFNNLKRYAEAEQVLTEVIVTMEKSPQTLKIVEERQRYSDAYLERAVSKFNNGNRPGGLADAEKSVSIAPQNQRAVDLLARMRAISGQ
ncbi:MAG: glycosyltransferase family 39 protein [Lewinellaceae bacterium]|nr:glycosyltransferase family 39 protein [Lewinellaceae bacterium]